MNTMKEGTRLRLGEFSSLRTNHQEARQQPLLCLLKVRRLKRGRRGKKGETELELRVMNGGFFDPECSRKHIGWKCVPLVDRSAFYRVLV
ncbi:hypothetical protein AVEN_209923-1 [Araneus ventricosus]|uniref:Uncharacterized protein n=1 Tax=Araneus ventricosus TaxID=182803 RepID=A0A4Y2EV82_ARAVE|nr:hypothetical protein AVEN_155343-1 [Araneus ventricosus]GBM32088.1 hypothetical protein AVEN_209923-1 [Araneus ventricosus]